MSKQNILSLSFAATECNGWPQIRVRLNNKIIEDCCVNNKLDISVAVETPTKDYTLCIERYGKTETNFVFENDKIVKDQIVELTSIKVDGITIPNFIISEHTEFRFDDQLHKGSCYFSPNGVWKFKFQAPVVTWLLDQKILHESKYNTDYQYDWSYKLGPNSVSTLSNQFEDALKRIDQIYD